MSGEWQYSADNYKLPIAQENKAEPRRRFVLVTRLRSIGLVEECLELVLDIFYRIRTLKGKTVGREGRHPLELMDSSRRESNILSLLRCAFCHGAAPRVSTADEKILLDPQCDEVRDITVVVGCGCRPQGLQSRNSSSCFILLGMDRWGLPGLNNVQLWPRTPLK